MKTTKKSIAVVMALLCVATALFCSCNQKTATPRIAELSDESITVKKGEIGYVAMYFEYAEITDRSTFAGYEAEYIDSDEDTPKWVSPYYWCPCYTYENDEEPKLDLSGWVTTYFTEPKEDELTKKHYKEYKEMYEKYQAIFEKNDITLITDLTEEDIPEEIMTFVKDNLTINESSDREFTNIKTIGANETSICLIFAIQGCNVGTSTMSIKAGDTTKTVTINVVE